MKIKLPLLMMLFIGLTSCKKDTGGNAVPVPLPVSTKPETPPAIITTAYLVVITANADTTRSVTIPVSE